MGKVKIKSPKLIDSIALEAELAAFCQANGGIGDNHLVRAKVLEALKQANKSGREYARTMLDLERNGTLCALRLSALQDELIRIIHDFAVYRVYRTQNPSAGEHLSVVAVGGYGRGTLAPQSDIDLLFVMPYKQTAWGEQVVEYILYMLWDMGFKVGHATRNVDECIRQASADMTIRTSLLEARYVWGSKALYEEMIKRFDHEIVRNTAAEFIEAKLTERDDRHEKSGRSRYLVEPNVKDGKGGFRDLHTLFWIGKYYYRVSSAPDLVKAGLFSKAEFAVFRRAEKFLWTVRCHLHFLTGRADERLSFEIQRELAQHLYYVSRGGLRDVERFMRHYFMVAKQVGDLTLVVCSQLEEEQAKSVRGINGLIRSLTRGKPKAIEGTVDFVNESGRINVASEEVFIEDPVNLLRLYKLADANNLDLHPDAVQLASRNLKLIKDKVRKDPVANTLFMDILTSSSNPEPILRKMNESGILGRFIPSFGKIVAMMQFSMYHHYTVDEHLLKTVGVLWKIESGKASEEHPLADEILGLVKNRVPLYLATLIHDIAKGRKEDHSIAGAKVAAKLCPRLGLNRDESKLVEWLVREHLTMSNTAQTRDLSDRKTIEDFAAIVGNMERLRCLLVLTICDIRAVGPGVWNGWKGQLLRTLYYETERLFEEGELTQSIKVRAQSVKEEVSKVLGDWDEAERERVLSLPYDAYYIGADINALPRYLTFIRDADARADVFSCGVQVKAFEAVTELTILSPDHPALLANIAGVCAANDANIVGAQIDMLHDGRAFDTILITRKFDKDEDEARRADILASSIAQTLASGKRPQIKSSVLTATQSRREAFDVPSKVKIDNKLSRHFTVLELKGLDRPGILAALSQTIYNLNLNIGSAHITTFGEKVVDTFYVTDLTGQKITSETRHDTIRKQLLAVLNNDVEEDTHAA